MAGDWIKFELATPDKPEVCQIADMANIDLDAVVGKLLRVWGWFDQQTSDGNAPSVTKKLLDRLVGVTGFCDCMVAVDWMMDDGTTNSLPNFDRHNGKTAKNRALTAKRVASHKSGNAKGNDKGNAASVTEPQADALPREEKILNPSHTPRDEPLQQEDGPFAMHLDWQPSARLLAAYARTAGVLFQQFTPEAIGPFIVHHTAKNTFKTEAEHVSALVNWVKRDLANASKVVPLAGRRTVGGDFDDNATGWLGE